MFQIRRGWIFWSVLSLIGSSLISCQNFSSTVLGSEKTDSLENEKAVIKPLLLNKWDSLNKNLIKFHVDTLNPIDVKTQKKQLKDSLKKEFDKLPKHVFLTFDDGPLVGSKAIDSLATAKNIKVSVFLVGRHANFSKSRMNEVTRYKENPLVATYNHSFTHGYNKFNHFYNNTIASVKDFEKNEKDLALTHKIARLPGRNIWIYDNIRRIDLQNGSKTADSLAQNGYKLFGWDTEWRINSLSGVPVQSLESVHVKMRNYLNNKSSQTPNNVVLLMHDDMFQTKKGRQLLANLIDSLKKENYKFEFMEDYPVKY